MAASVITEYNNVGSVTGVYSLIYISNTASIINSTRIGGPVVSTGVATLPPGLFTTTASTPLSSSTSAGPPGPTSNTPSNTQSATPNSISSIQPSTTSSSLPASQSAGHMSNHLANGTVAGIVIGVAIGLALITFLATFLAMRRRGGSRDKQRRQGSAREDELSGSARHQTLGSEPKQPLVTENSSGSNSLDNFLPQSADDKTVQNNVKTILEQIELHVENFYQNTPISGSRPADAELAIFDSPYLPSSLATLLPKTSNRILLIKHALAHYITSCITTTADSDWSLLPKVFVLLPHEVRTGSSAKSAKPGEQTVTSTYKTLIEVFTDFTEDFIQSMSRWRVLTAYLRSNTLEDHSYVVQREHQINSIVHNRWKSELC